MTKLGQGFIAGFNWELHPKAEKFLKREVSNFLKHNSFARKLAKRMEKESSTTFFDWIDHIYLPSKIVKGKGFLKLGFKNVSNFDGVHVFKNSGSVFFSVLFSHDDYVEICLKPENIEDFVKKNKIKTNIGGKKFNSLRKAYIKKEGKYILSVIERRGSNDFVVKDDKDINEYKKALQIFSKRKRKLKNDQQGMAYTHQLILNVLRKLSPARTTDAFFRNERIYWQKRNKAGQIQKKRQDRFGLGWGNHDHHTFRSSRENFPHLIRIFEDLGYKCRERFFAGEKAGWGAQVLEHPECDIVLFSDLDITKQEKNKDFAHRGVKNVDHYGTVGLWIALHGESILQSGMHHLEARFMFEKLTRGLGKNRIMKPFSYFPFLKQAFTKGEIWKVDRDRLNNLLKKGKISKEKYNDFIKNGVIGSHMENLQRRQGFKGFNQDSVTAVIKATDPRKQLHKEYHKHRGA